MRSTSRRIMANYKASQKLTGWKQHRCAGCGAVYRYVFNRSLTATARSPANAQAALSKLVARAMQTGVDSRPCPHCGVIQPDMVAAHRRGRFNLWLWLILLGFSTLAIVGLSQGVNLPTLITVATLFGLVSAAALAWIGSRNPNRDLDANLRSAGSLLSAGTLGLDQPGVPDLARRGPMLPGLGLLAPLFLGFGVIALPLAEVQRTVARWPLNPRFYPPVAGPGDQTTIYLPEKIHSVKGYWNGEPRVVARNAAALGLRAPEIAAVSSKDSWGGTISAKSSQKDNTSTPWTTLTLPTEPATLPGKTAQLVIDLSVTYPQLVGDRTSWQTMRQTMHTDADLTLAPAHAGALYWNLWFYGLLVGSLLLLGAVLLLKSGVRAHPSRNTQLGMLPLAPGVPPVAPTASVPPPMMPQPPPPPMMPPPLPPR